MRDNLSIIRDSYACGAKGDILGLLADIENNGKWTEMTGNLYAGTFIGQDEILQNVFAKINDDWDDFAAIPSEFFVAGDTVMVLGAYSGCNKITKMNFIVRFSHVWTLKDGKIINFEQFTDTAIMRYAANQPYQGY